MSERTTVRLPQELLNRAKRKAAAEGRTLTSLIAEGLRMVVADDRKPASVMRGLPPVSEAVGGLLPCVNLVDADPLQEADDIEAVRRLTRSK